MGDFGKSQPRGKILLPSGIEQMVLAVIAFNNGAAPVVIIGIFKNVVFGKLIEPVRKGQVVA